MKERAAVRLPYIETVLTRKGAFVYDDVPGKSDRRRCLIMREYRTNSKLEYLLRTSVTL